MLTFTDEDLSGGFIGEGTHKVRITEVEKTTSAAGNPMLVVTCTGEAGSKKEYLALTKEARWRIGAMAVACGFDRAYLKEHGLESPGVLKGKEFTLTVTAKGVDSEGRTNYDTRYNTITEPVLNTATSGTNAGDANGGEQLPEWA